MNKSRNFDTISFPVEGMTCRSCVKRVEDALLKHEGVIGAYVDLSRHMVQVNYNTSIVNAEVLKQSVKDAGYVTPNCDAPEQNARQNRTEYSQTLFSKLIPYLIGLTASLGVVGFYLGLLTLTSDWYFAKVQFGDYRWWIIALALGLGIQGILFSLMRVRLRRENMRGAKSSIAASGGMSAVSMAVCCAHFLPTLGLPFLSAAAAGLERYQTLFFLIGVLSNLYGIVFMFRMMVKNGMIASGIFSNRMNLSVRRS